VYSASFSEVSVFSVIQPYEPGATIQGNSAHGDSNVTGALDLGQRMDPTLLGERHRCHVRCLDQEHVVGCACARTDESMEEKRLDATVLYCKGTGRGNDYEGL
jgi:hypothetical protein